MVMLADVGGISGVRTTLSSVKVPPDVIDEIVKILEETSGDLDPDGFRAGQRAPGTATAAARACWPTHTEKAHLTLSNSVLEAGLRPPGDRRGDEAVRRRDLAGRRQLRAGRPGAARPHRAGRRPDGRRPPHAASTHAPTGPGATTDGQPLTTATALQQALSTADEQSLGDVSTNWSTNSTLLDQVAAQRPHSRPQARQRDRRRGRARHGRQLHRDQRQASTVDSADMKKGSGRARRRPGRGPRGDQDPQRHHAVERPEPEPTGPSGPTPGTQPTTEAGDGDGAVQRTDRSPTTPTSRPTRTRRGPPWSRWTPTTPWRPR